MATTKDTVVFLKGRECDATPDAQGSEESDKRSGQVFAPGVVKVLEDVLARAREGHVAGVSVIAYAPDWGWKMTNAGSVLSVPAVGIAAAHVLASQFERRLRGGKPVS